MVENELPGYEEILFSLEEKDVPVIGVTGPPGAGKSSLISCLLDRFTAEGKKTAVLAVDPTSPFNFGSLLGDRLRMTSHFNTDLVYIRSMATRGSLGGLSEKAVEIAGVITSADFDYLLIETVGVGQSEVEIAGLADTTVVVFVPESGDEIQTMKSGIMEIADIFVVNKSDREGAELFANNLRKEVHSKVLHGWNTPVINVSAIQATGIDELINQLTKHRQSATVNSRKLPLLVEKAYRLIQKNRMADVSKAGLLEAIEREIKTPGFNLYRFAASCA